MKSLRKLGDGDIVSGSILSLLGTLSKSREGITNNVTTSRDLQYTTAPFGIFLKSTEAFFLCDYQLSLRTFSGPS